MLSGVDKILLTCEEELREEVHSLIEENPHEVLRIIQNATIARSLFYFFLKVEEEEYEH